MQLTDHGCRREHVASTAARQVVVGRREVVPGRPPAATAAGAGRRQRQRRLLRVTVALAPLGGACAGRVRHDVGTPTDAVHFESSLVVELLGRSVKVVHT